MSAFSRKRFRELRKAAGFTGEELARRAGVSNSLVQKIEQGAATPSLASLTKFISVFGCEAGDLFDDSEAVSLPSDLSPEVARWIQRMLDTAPPMSEETARRVSAVLFAAKSTSGAASDDRPPPAA